MATRPVTINGRGAAVEPDAALPRLQRPNLLGVRQLAIRTVVAKLAAAGPPPLRYMASGRPLLAALRRPPIAVPVPGQTWLEAAMPLTWLAGRPGERPRRPVAPLPLTPSNALVVGRRVRLASLAAPLDGLRRRLYKRPP